jgi:hypothetical protein
MGSLARLLVSDRAQTKPSLRGASKGGKNAKQRRTCPCNSNVHYVNNSGSFYWRILMNWRDLCKLPFRNTRVATSHSRETRCTGSTLRPGHHGRAREVGGGRSSAAFCCPIGARLRATCRRRLSRHLVQKGDLLKIRFSNLLPIRA